MSEQKQFISTVTGIFPCWPFTHTHSRLLLCAVWPMRMVYVLGRTRNPFCWCSLSDCPLTILPIYPPTRGRPPKWNADMMPHSFRRTSMLTVMLIITLLMATDSLLNLFKRFDWMLPGYLQLDWILNSFTQQWLNAPDLCVLPQETPGTLISCFVHFDWKLHS